jgi:fibronectin type III domain protein
MSHLTNKLSFSPKTRAMKARRLRRLTAIVAGILLATMSVLTGCAGGGETGSDTAAPGSVGVTASLDWTPVPDPSVSAYFVHYGRQSPHHPGSCAYEHSVSVDSPSATLSNLDPDTRYYFTVSAYNGLESACSNEVSTVTPPSV